MPAAAFVGVPYFRTVGVRRWAGDENRATRHRGILRGPPLVSHDHCAMVGILGGFATGVRYVNVLMGDKVLFSAMIL